jgi:HK97 family phage major capsid protein
MPDIGFEAIPIIFGDFRSGYLIVDNRGIIFIRDDITLAGEFKTQIYALQRTGSDTKQPEALVKYRIKA